MKGLGKTISAAIITLLFSCSLAGAQSTNAIPLVAGWNLISLPVQPANTTIASVLSGIKGAYEVVWAYPNQTWKVYDPNDAAGSTLATMQAGMGYWIKMTSAQTLPVSGSAPLLSVSLLSGWNLVGGYPGTSCAAPSTALSALGPALQVAWGYPSEAWQFYDPTNSSSPLTQLCPGAGYWIEVGQALPWAPGSPAAALREIQGRVTANQTSFYVYKDQDSGFNHGFPSGFFASSNGNLGTIHLDVGCVDDPADTTTGCYSSTDTSALDTARGTVMRISFDAQTSASFAGVNIEEPQNWGTLQTGAGYDLSTARNVVFDVRSPDKGTVQFGVGKCVTQFLQIPLNWETLTIPLSSLTSPQGEAVSCPPALDAVHVLFTVATNNQHAPNGATVLLDNIWFTPVPARTAQTQEGENLSLPLSTQTFGVVPQTSASIPPDQANRNIAAIYEAALSIRTLLNQGDATDAKEIADALDYALYHDNEGDYISTAPSLTSGCFSGSAATQCGLHNAYESGDIALLNDQNGGSGAAKAGDSRLSGFTCGALSPNGYCLVLDGATGGNNAWAILALLAEYKQSGNVKYLNDATAIGNWIIANLTDTTGTGFGGYYVGYPDQGAPVPKAMNLGKSTENNADIFAAFTALAEFDSSNAGAWTTAANVAGDFVMEMFDVTNGRFNTGTVTVSPPTTAGPGSCPTGATKGNDIINANSSPDCDFLDSDTFTTLAMAGSPRYSNYQLANNEVMDWTRPVQYVLNTFAQTIAVGSQTFQGFDIVSTPVSGANGAAWEFTGQAVETMRYVDQLYNRTTFEAQANFYLGQIQLAQALAPFADEQGLVASTLQNGNTLQPLNQCLNTPYQNCPPERVGLAATNWMIAAEKQINPLAGP